MSMVLAVTPSDYLLKDELNLKTDQFKSTITDITFSASFVKNRP
jgi:hypothetical protein